MYNVNMINPKELEQGFIRHKGRKAGFGIESATETAQKLEEFIEGLSIADAIDLAVVLYNRRIAREKLNGHNRLPYPK